MASLWHGSILGHNGLLTFMRILLSAFWENNLLDLILKYSIILSLKLHTTTKFSPEGSVEIFSIGKYFVDMVRD